MDKKELGNFGENVVAYYLEKKDNASAKKYLGKYLEINPQDDKIKKAYNAL